MSNLYKAFYEYFEITIVETPGLLEIVFRMRYQKLCIDMSVFQNMKFHFILAGRRR